MPDPTSRSGRTKTTYPIEILSRDEIDRLLRACSKRAPSGIRDRALIAVMFGAGLRVAEALALELKDLDLATGRITVLRGKGSSSAVSKRRLVAIDEGMGSVVEAWVSCRRRLEIPNRGRLFCGISKSNLGAPVSAANVRQMLSRRRIKAGIEKRVHPHGFRHSHAVELAAAGLPINVISVQLGHAHSSTTSRYLDHLSPEAVVNAVRSRSIPGK